MRYPQLSDYEGDYDALAEAQSAYEDYLSDVEDRAKERYYEEKYC